MDITKLIERLTELADYVEPREWDLPHLFPLDLADVLREAAEKLKKMRWIPVAEKVPDPYETVIVSVATRNGFEEPISLETLASYENRNDVWKDGLDGSPVTKAEYEHVTHWMHMPEPPEVSEDD